MIHLQASSSPGYSTGHPALDALLIFVAALTALATIAALAHKPPLRQLGQLFAFIARRLIGEPVGKWADRHFLEHVQPLVVTTVTAAVEQAVAPIRGQQEAAATELRVHMKHEGSLLEQLQKEHEEHRQDDRERFDAIDARMAREEHDTREERAEMLQMLRNVQQATIDPHPGMRTSPER